MRIRDLSAPMGALCLAVLVSLAGCGGGGNAGPGAMPGPNTFSITIATKNMTHPNFGQGSAFGLVVDGVQGGVINLTIGETYMFNVTTPTHPVYFTMSAMGGISFPGRITTGVTNDQITNGVMTFTPDNTLPLQFFYQCGVHTFMGWEVRLSP